MSEGKYADDLGASHKFSINVWLCWIVDILLQLFDISTTVDPSYIISLIRKLLPATVKSPNQTKDAPAPESNFISFSKIEASISKDNGLHRFENASERMGIADDIHNSSLGNSCNVVDHPNNDLVGEEAWEEYGCILWDLAASTTHAELMVPVKSPSPTFF